MTDLFQEIENVFTKREMPDIENVYMVNRFLSMYHKTFSKVHFINLLANKLPKWTVSRLLYLMMPKILNVPRIPYIKKDIDKLKPKQKKEIKMLMNYFYCSDKHAGQIHQILVNQKVDISKIFGEKMRRVK